MERKEWKYGKGSEWYTVLFHEHGTIMVQNENTGKISFGPEDDFGKFYGFSVNNSCLTLNQAIARMKRLLSIDKKKEYAELQKFYLDTLGWNHITVEEAMLDVLNSMKGAEQHERNIPKMGQS